MTIVCLDEMEQKLTTMDSLTLLGFGLWLARRDYSRRRTGRGLLGWRLMLLLGFTLYGSYGKGSRASTRMKERVLWKARRS